MPKRKAVDDLSAEGSDLSPPPNDLDDGAVALANANADLEPENQPAKKRRTTARATKQEVKKESDQSFTPKKSLRARKVKPEPTEEAPLQSEDTQGVAPKKRQRKTQTIKEEDEETDGELQKPAPKGRARKNAEPKKQAEAAQENGQPAEKPAKKKRKTKEEKEAENMPVAARTVGHKLYIGAHVSSAGGQCPFELLDSIHICLQRKPLLSVPTYN